jgi:hypothetical protein
MAGLSMRQLPVEPSGSKFCPEYLTVNDIRRCNAIAVNSGTGHAPPAVIDEPPGMGGDYEFST